MKGILLVPIGELREEVLNKLKVELEERFHWPVAIGKSMLEPYYAYDQKRNQYPANFILKAIEKEKSSQSYERVLGIVDHDLYVPELNFVFGLAGQRVAILSLTRLRQEFYGLSNDRRLFERRVLTEAVHELGHTYGLGHCRNPGCVMFFSNSLTDTDRKGPDFCSRCKIHISNDPDEP